MEGHRVMSESESEGALLRSDTRRSATVGDIAEPSISLQTAARGTASSPCVSRSQGPRRRSVQRELARMQPPCLPHEDSSQKVVTALPTVANVDLADERRRLSQHSESPAAATRALPAECRRPDPRRGSPGVFPPNHTAVVHPQQLSTLWTTRHRARSGSKAPQSGHPPRRETDAGAAGSARVGTGRAGSPGSPQTSSRIVAFAVPPPSHIVCKPNRIPCSRM